MINVPRKGRSISLPHHPLAPVGNFPPLTATWAKVPGYQTSERSFQGSFLLLPAALLHLPRGWGYPLAGAPQVAHWNSQAKDLGAFEASAPPTSALDL